MDEIDLESILGGTEDGQWVSDALPAAEGRNEEQEEGSKLGAGCSQRHSHCSYSVRDVSSHGKSSPLLLGPVTI